MPYWNQENFKGLAELACALDTMDGFGHLVDYCRLREAGLRHDAFVALDAFLATAKDWDPDRARAAAITILELHARTRDAHWFLSFPLLQLFILPTLNVWLQSQPADSRPARWLGLLNHDESLLLRALDANPDDEVVRRRLIENQISSADYATHHLVEGLFLGTPEEAIAALDQADRLITLAPAQDRFSCQRREIQHLRQKISDWLEYRPAPEGTFPEWCAAHGRDYRWPNIIYYSRKPKREPDGSS